MYKGVTPTYTLKFPDTVDLSEANSVFVSFSDKSRKELLRKTGEELNVDQNMISVSLSQEETLDFPSGAILIQANWTYPDGGRACSVVAQDTYEDNLAREVL